VNYVLLAQCFTRTNSSRNGSNYCHMLEIQVQAYLYDGYWEDIGTIEAFYNANLGITKKPIPDFSFYDRSAPIYTQARFLPPSKMLDADVMDSVIGEGCIIQVTPLIVVKDCVHHAVILAHFAPTISIT
jgi:glucose-1-phosphate adenylyltransferase